MPYSAGCLKQQTAVSPCSGRSGVRAAAAPSPLRPPSASASVLPCSPGKTAVQGSPNKLTVTALHFQRPTHEYSYITGLALKI